MTDNSDGGFEVSLETHITSEHNLYFSVSLISALVAQGCSCIGLKWKESIDAWY